MDKVKILIVEDELLIAKSLSRMLAKLGYEVVDVVSSGEAAVQKVAELQPSLVLMDIVIKGDMDGIDAAAEIYSRYNVPVVYLTAYADDQTLQRAERTGSYGYILKPCQERELHATIKMVLSKHNQESQVLRSLDAAKALSQELQSTIKIATLHLGRPDQLSLELDLSQALSRQEFELYYQPRVSLKTGQIVSAEALLRWHHPHRGTIMPSTFIPLAEELGLIEQIGDWVLLQVCRQVKAWLAEGLPPIQVAVNLSVHQFNQPDLNLRLSNLLEEFQLDPQYLGLELTETILVTDIGRAVQKLNAFRSLGIESSIDDFGKGYSSLSYLQKFPFDILKIDQCFVHNIHINQTNRAIATTIIEMAHKLNLKVVAEGVETQAELNILYEHNCDEIQGYFFSYPLPSQEFAALVRSGKILPIRSDK